MRVSMVTIAHASREAHSPQYVGVAMGRIADLVRRVFRGNSAGALARSGLTLNAAQGPELHPLILSQIKSLRPGDVLPSSWDGRPQWSEWDSEAAINEGLKASSYVYICIKRNASAIGTLPWIVEQQTGPRQYEPVPDTHPLQVILDTPNPYWSAQHLRELIVMELFLTGNSLILKIRENEIPVELWTARPQNIAPNPAKGDFVVSYTVKGADGKEHTVLPEDAIHVQFPDPACPYWGLSPLQSASKAVDTDVEAATWQKVALQNMLVPPGVFLIKGHITEDQFNLARAQIKDRYAGADNAGEPMILGGQGGNEVSWQQMGLTPAEVSFIETRKLTREEICSILGVPPPIVGILDRATYNNIRTAREIWWEDTLLPTAGLVESALNRSLAPEFGEGLRIRIDTSQVDALLVLFERRLAVVERLCDRGAPFNSASEFMDLGYTFDGGDVGYLPANLIPVDSVTSGQLDEDEEKAGWFGDSDEESPGVNGSGNGRAHFDG